MIISDTGLECKSDRLVNFGRSAYALSRMPAKSDKISWEYLQEARHAGRPISVLTCYDAGTARLMQEAGVEVLLVGDTAAEVILGLPSTREIPPEFLITLTAAVRRGAPDVFVMADLPYRCRCGTHEETLGWSRRFVDETGADGVKIEVNGGDVALVEKLAGAGLGIIAHLGLLPQQLAEEGVYRAQGRDSISARRLMDEAQAMEQAGASALLLEAVASEVTREITERANIPVIGCVAGPHCSGTVVVLHDMIGHAAGHPPRMVRQYEDLSSILTRAFAAYVDDIHKRRFPTEADSIHMKPGEWEKILAPR